MAFLKCSDCSNMLKAIHKLSIRGELGKYIIEMSVYHFDGTSLRDAHLYFSEREMLMKLAKGKR